MRPLRATARWNPPPDPRPLPSPSQGYYFYELRKHYLARLVVDHGYNVLHTDADVAWLVDPYPLLRTVRNLAS